MAKTNTEELAIEEGIDIGALFDTGGDLWDGYTPPQPRDPLPKGTYDAVVNLVEGPMPNRAGDGSNMKFTFDVFSEDEEYPRKVFMYLSLKETVRWKVQQTFSALGKEPGDNMYIPGEFDGNPCRVVLEVTPERPKNDGTEDTWPASNGIKRVLPPRKDQETVSWL